VGDAHPWVSRLFSGSVWVRISSDLGAVVGLVRTFLDLRRISLDFGRGLAPELCLILSVLPAVWAMSEISLVLPAREEVKVCFCRSLLHFDID
jgi:hypothetical protein